MTSETFFEDVSKRLMRPQRKLSMLNYTQMEIRIMAEFAGARKKRRFSQLSSFLARKLLHG